MTTTNNLQRHCTCDMRADVMHEIIENARKYNSLSIRLI